MALEWRVTVWVANSFLLPNSCFFFFFKALLHSTRGFILCNILFIYGKIHIICGQTFFFFFFFFTTNDIYFILEGVIGEVRYSFFRIYVPTPYSTVFLLHAHASDLLKSVLA